jgi:hypothetical protein
MKLYRVRIQSPSKHTPNPPKSTIFITPAQRKSDAIFKATRQWEAKGNSGRRLFLVECEHFTSTTIKRTENENLVVLDHEHDQHNYRWWRTARFSRYAPDEFWWTRPNLGLADFEIEEGLEPYPGQKRVESGHLVDSLI